MIGWLRLRLEFSSCGIVGGRFRREEGMRVHQVVATDETKQQPDHNAQPDTEYQEVAGEGCVNCKEEAAAGDDDENSLPVPADGKLVVVNARMRFITLLHTCLLAVVIKSRS